MSVLGAEEEARLRRRVEDMELLRRQVQAQDLMEVRNELKRQEVL